MKPALVFIGFMGAGKSTALAAARDAGLQTTEIDALMEKAFGKAIRQAFEEDGEDAFRAREAEVVGSLLEEADGGAIALGGGSVLSERVREALDRHFVVWLQVDAREAWRRIARSDRPLANKAEDVERLLLERLPFYESLADAILPPGDRGLVARAMPSLVALTNLPQGTKMLWATSASGEYPVFVGPGLLGTGPWPLPGKRFCITDTNVGPLYADRIQPLAAQIEVPPGEASKDIEELPLLLEKIGETQMTREDHFVALGGGVIGDLAGFCAHIYQRGVPVIQVPTSLVAQVDSAYGGKTGVDTAHGKNYVGAYHLPAAVLADTSTLESLPYEELAAGFVEALKTGLLAGGTLWGQVKEMDTLSSADLKSLVFACARYKCEVVAKDERDSGLREILNLGHTIGHAIEAASGYSSYRHGEAIGLGLLAALRLSDADDLREEVKAILMKHRLPVVLEDGDTDVVLALIERDKKRTSEGVGFVLLSEPGSPRTGELVDPAKVEAAVLELYP
ncbi:MAG: shikimate kinase / 3-dehydroquinate synthase [Solirubrobacterales bacterium]|jgi:shikimate kinase/3-dehydroquinate synthase|nr:shikimate kinase / 3-dehydroquinate synthase [Solirubrobacterales bacterium]